MRLSGVRTLAQATQPDPRNGTAASSISRLLEPANPPEPANQLALGHAADDAQAIAGSDYYTSTWVDAAANTVDVYLADAPPSIIDQLEARHPGIYVIHNDAAHPLSQLLRLQRALALGPLQTAAGTVNLVESYPTPDGHLKVGVEGDGDVEAAQSELDSMHGAGIIEVFGGAQRADNLLFHLKTK